MKTHAKDYEKDQGLKQHAYNSRRLSSNSRKLACDNKPYNIIIN
jgi:hypothetical protein